MNHRYGTASRVCLECGYTEMEVAEGRAPLKCWSDDVELVPMTMSLLEQHDEIVRRCRAIAGELSELTLYHRMSLYAAERQKLLDDLRRRALTKRDIIEGAFDTLAARADELAFGMLPPGTPVVFGLDLAARDLTTGFVSHVVTYDPETGVRYERIVMNDKPRTAEQINDACAGNRPMPPAKPPVTEGPSGPTRHKHWTDKS